MRVIAGRLRGRRVNAPKSGAVRPTYDRVRESVFAILDPGLGDASVLDLFAGSGVLGIESLSRGAASVTFVEQDPRVLALIERNVTELALTRQSRLVRGDARKLLGGALPGAPFDLVFVDPPYRERLAREILMLLGGWVGLAAGALVVVEHGADDELEERYGNLTRTRNKRYGDTAVDIYEALDDQHTTREGE